MSTLPAHSSAFLAYRHDLQAYIRGMTGDPVLAEDILQDVWLALADASTKEQRIENLPAWCRSVAKHAILRHWRSSSRQRYVQDETILDLVADGFGSSLEDPDGTTARIAALQDCLGRLQDRGRRLLERRHLDGASPEAMAAEERTTVKALLMKLSRLRDSLRDCVTNRLRVCTND